MANAKKCDLCAGLYSDNNHMECKVYYSTKSLSRSHHVSVRFAIRPLTRDQEEQEVADVCPPCFTEIINKVQKEVTRNV